MEETKDLVKAVEEKNYMDFEAKAKEILKQKLESKTPKKEQ